MATEAAWLDGNNMEKEETKKNKGKNERRALTLTGLLMEGAIQVPFVAALLICLYGGWSSGDKSACAWNMCNKEQTQMC